VESLVELLTGEKPCEENWGLYTLVLEYGLHELKNSKVSNKPGLNAGHKQKKFN